MTNYSIKPKGLSIKVDEFRTRFKCTTTRKIGIEIEITITLGRIQGQWKLMMMMKMIRLKED